MIWKVLASKGAVRYPRPPIFTIIYIGSNIEPIFLEILLYFLWIGRILTSAFCSVRQFCCEWTKTKFFITKNRLYICFAFFKIFPVKSLYFGRKFLYFPMILNLNSLFFPIRFFKKLLGCLSSKHMYMHYTEIFWYFTSVHLFPCTSCRSSRIKFVC